MIQVRRDLSSPIVAPLAQVLTGELLQNESACDDVFRLLVELMIWHEHFRGLEVFNLSLDLYFFPVAPKLEQNLFTDTLTCNQMIEIQAFVFRVHESAVRIESVAVNS
ncbi:hypothetical protein ES703_58269 [subsurface metagenome]